MTVDLKWLLELGWLLECLTNFHNWSTSKSKRWFRFMNLFLQHVKLCLVKANFFFFPPFLKDWWCLNVDFKSLLKYSITACNLQYLSSKLCYLPVFFLAVFLGAGIMLSWITSLSTPVFLKSKEGYISQNFHMQLVDLTP